MLKHNNDIGKRLDNFHGYNMKYGFNMSILSGSKMSCAKFLLNMKI